VTDYDMRRRFEALLAKRNRYHLPSTRLVEIHIEDDRGLPRDHIVFDVDIGGPYEQRRTERIPA